MVLFPKKKTESPVLSSYFREDLGICCSLSEAAEVSCAWENKPCAAKFFEIYVVPHKGLEVMGVPRYLSRGQTSDNREALTVADKDVTCPRFQVFTQ